MKKARFLAALLALAAGIGHWYLTGVAQRLAYRGFARALGSNLVSLLTNAAIEELLRMALIGAAAFALARDPEVSAARKKVQLYAFALLAGWAFGSIENMNYLMAFPTLDVFWRLGYSLPIHVNAGILYAFALFPTAGEGRGLFGSARATALRVASALILGLSWHGAFNAFASFGFFKGLPALGSALNAAAFFTLAFFIERNFIVTGAFHGRTRA